MHFSAPLYVVWEITLLCNLRCIHCYSRAGVPHPNELTTEEAEGVIRQLADAGVIILGFSGGEPLLRPDWRRLLGLAVECGLLVSVGTNGIVIKDHIAADLKDLGVHSVCVSLDGSTPAIHEQVRQMPGLFEKTVEAIQCLVRHGIRVVVGFTPVRHNFQEARSVVELAYELGASAVNLSEFVPVGRGTLDLCLRPEELHDVILTWAELKKFYQGRLEVYWHDCRAALLVPPDEQHKYIGCSAGVGMARITMEGHITPCVTLPISVGNLRERRFMDIWTSSPFLAKIRDRANIMTGNCSDCEFKNTCGGCRSVSMGFHGDPFRGDPYCWVVKEMDAWVG